jgi:hypothetical protein
MMQRFRPDVALIDINISQPVPAPILHEEGELLENANLFPSRPGDNPEATPHISSESDRHKAEDRLRTGGSPAFWGSPK